MHSWTEDYRQLLSSILDLFYNDNDELAARLIISQDVDMYHLIAHLTDNNKQYQLKVTPIIIMLVYNFDIPKIIKEDGRV